MPVAAAKKILFLNANLRSGGAERQMVTVARLLKQEGHEVSFYCYDSGDFYEHLLREYDIPVIWDYSMNDPLKRFCLIRHYIRNGNFDAVISFLPPANFLNDFAAIGGKKWKVITGIRWFPARPYKSVKDRLYLLFQRYTDYIICNSSIARERMGLFYPYLLGKLKTIYNNVQVSDQTSDYEFHRNGKLNIVVAASFQYLKNPLGLVHALTLMTEEEKEDIRIDWYGQSDGTNCYNDTINAIKKNSLNDILLLHEVSKAIHNIMRGSDAVMLISKQEGLPNAICEGMSLGKPIIMTRVSDYNVLVDETNGFLCDSDNPISIKEAILNMRNTSKERLMEMGNSSLSKADELFSSKTICNQWLRFI